MPRLTEALLEREMQRHAENCDDCVEEYCDRALAIEGAFWNEVDRRMEEAREGGWDA